MIYPFIFSCVVYPVVGFNSNFGSFVLFSVILTLNILTAQGVGLFISAIFMDVRQGQVLASIWILGSMLISGYYIDPENTPDFVKPIRSVSFIKVCIHHCMISFKLIQFIQKNIFTNLPNSFSLLTKQYSYEALVRTEMLFGQTFECEKESRMQTIYSRFGCPIDSDKLLRAAEIDSSLSIPWNIAVLIAWIVLFRVAGYFALKLLHTNHKPKLSSWKRN